MYDKISKDVKVKVAAHYEEVKEIVGAKYEEVKVKVAGAYREVKRKVAGAYKEVTEMVAGKYEEVKTTVAGAYKTIKRIVPAGYKLVKKWVAHKVDEANSNIATVVNTVGAKIPAGEIEIPLPFGGSVKLGVEHSINDQPIMVGYSNGAPTVEFKGNGLSTEMDNEGGKVVVNPFNGLAGEIEFHPNGFMYLTPEIDTAHYKARFGYGESGSGWDKTSTQKFEISTKPNGTVGSTKFTFEMNRKPNKEAAVAVGVLVVAGVVVLGAVLIPVGALAGAVAAGGTAIAGAATAAGVFITNAGPKVMEFLSRYLSGSQFAY